MLRDNKMIFGKCNVYINKVTYVFFLKKKYTAIAAVKQRRPLSDLMCPENRRTLVCAIARPFTLVFGRLDPRYLEVII